MKIYCDLDRWKLQLQIILNTCKRFAISVYANLSWTQDSALGKYLHLLFIDCSILFWNINSYISSHQAAMKRPEIRFDGQRYSCHIYSPN